MCSAGTPKFTKITLQLINYPLSKNDQDVLEELFRADLEMMADCDDELLTPPISLRHHLLHRQSVAKLQGCPAESFYKRRSESC